MSTPRILPAALEFGQWEDLPRLHGREEYREFTDAFHAVTRGIVKLVAADLGLSRSRVDNIRDGEAPTYGVQMARSIDRALRERNSQAFAELVVLNHRYGARLVFDEAAPAAAAGCLAESIGAMAREFGEAMAVAVQRCSDGVVTSEDSELSIRELEQLEQEINNLKNRIRVRTVATLPVAPLHLP